MHIKGFLKRPPTKRAGELLNLSRNKLRITGLANRTVTEKDIYLNWGWYTVPCVTDENRNLKQHHIFFVTVRHWQY